MNWQIITNVLLILFKLLSTTAARVTFISATTRATQMAALPIWIPMFYGSYPHTIKYILVL